MHNGKEANVSVASDGNVSCCFYSRGAQIRMFGFESEEHATHLARVLTGDAEWTPDVVDSGAYMFLSQKFRPRARRR